MKQFNANKAPEDMFTRATISYTRLRTHAQLTIM
jgi:hypothetical protein